MTKHFPGGGPQKDGEDPHFPYGREQVYPGGNFDYHLIPFEAAFAAGTAQIMPYYGMPVGTALEEVGFGFNRGVITGLLRERYGFDGVVCTDWGLLNDTPIAGHVLAGARLGRRAPERRGADAEGARRGRRPVRRRDLPATCSSSSSAAGRSPRSGSTSRCAGCCGTSSASACSTTRTSIPDAAAEIVGQRAFRERRRDGPAPLDRAAEGRRPCCRSTGRPKIYVEGVDAELPCATTPRSSGGPEDADVALLRLQTPYEPRDGLFLEQFFHAGRLDFDAGRARAPAGVLRTVPTIVEITLERAAVIPELAEAAAVLIAGFGASDAAVLDLVFGRAAAGGRLPVELPVVDGGGRAPAPGRAVRLGRPRLRVRCGHRSRRRNRRERLKPLSARRAAPRPGGGGGRGG